MLGTSCTSSTFCAVFTPIYGSWRVGSDQGAKRAQTWPIICAPRRTSARKAGFSPRQGKIPRDGCGAFPPLRPCLQPEDLCDDIAALGSGEQTAGDDGIGLGDAAVEVITTSLTQRFRRASDYLGDIVLAHAKPGQMAHLFAYRIIDDKRFSSHRPSPIDRDPRRARRMTAPRLDGSRSAR